MSETLPKLNQLTLTDDELLALSTMVSLAVAAYSGNPERMTLLLLQMKMNVLMLGDPCFKQVIESVLKLLETQGIEILKVEL